MLLEISYKIFTIILDAVTHKIYTYIIVNGRNFLLVHSEELDYTKLCEMNTHIFHTYRTFSP